MVAGKPFAGSLVQYQQKQQVTTPSADEDTGLEKILGFYEFKSMLVYKAGVIEFIGTTLLTFMSCASVVSILNYKYAVPPQYIAIVHIVLLAFFIIATAKSSGGHLNPMITFATMLTGFTTPARAVVYIIAQTLGAICGAGLLKAILDAEPFNLGGCSLGALSEGRALLAEAVGSCVLLFIAYGTALDAGQREVFGPILGPFFVSFTLALIIFAGSGLVPGFTGPGTNPSRCFGPAVITGNWHGQWVFWVGPLIASLLIALLYRTMPPSFNDKNPPASLVPDDKRDGGL